jgi:hypothetical protein
LVAGVTEFNLNNPKCKLKNKDLTKTILRNFKNIKNIKMCETTSVKICRISVRLPNLSLQTGANEHNHGLRASYEMAAYENSV